MSAWHDGFFVCVFVFFVFLPCLLFFISHFLLSVFLQIPLLSALVTFPSLLGLWYRGQTWKKVLGTRAYTQCQWVSVRCWCQFIGNCPFWRSLLKVLEKPKLKITASVNLLILKVSGFLLMFLNMLTPISAQKAIQTQLWARWGFVCLRLPRISWFVFFSYGLYLLCC